MRLALAGGGTGGHLVPGLHLLRWAQTQGLTPERVLWFTSGRPVEQRVLGDLSTRLPGMDVRTLALPLEGSGGGAPSTFNLLRRSPKAYGVARRALIEHRVDVLLGLGGFTALPCVLAARRLGLPTALYEVNAVPGRATRRLAPLSQRVLHAWPDSVPAPGADKHEVIGSVVGPGYRRAVGLEVRRSAKATLGLDPNRPLLSVLGGSQGAGALNRFILGQLDVLLAGGWQILHQTGPGRTHEAAHSREGYRSTEYIDAMAGILTATDLVLGRGGASTLSEVAAVGVPAWIVPYPHHADRHQWRNGDLLAGGVRMVEEAHLDGTLALELASWAGEQGAQPLASMRAAFPSFGEGGAPALWSALQSLAAQGASA